MAAVSANQSEKKKGAAWRPFFRVSFPRKREPNFLRRDIPVEFILGSVRHRPGSNAGRGEGAPYGSLSFNPYPPGVAETVTGGW